MKRICEIYDISKDYEMPIGTVLIIVSDIEKNKIRGDLGITYDLDVLRLIDVFKSYGLYVGSVVLAQFTEENDPAKAFEAKLASLGIKT